MKILLIEDIGSLAHVYMEYLKQENADIIHVSTGDKAFDYLSENVPDIILLDLTLPDVDGMDILRYVSKAGINSCVIVITVHGSVTRVVDAMRLGAFEYLQKPFDKNRLLLTVRNAMERIYLHQIVETYKSQFSRIEYHGMLGSSQIMQSVYDAIDNVASSSATVFITGESGTGKELCAQAIHAKSSRGDKEMVILNCGAIARDLMESEIFGHVKGAFTGAISDRKGAAQRADGGTLFLDEIGELGPDLQSKLLRLIQSGTFQPVGSSRTRTVDIRYLCATNRDPMEMVEKGLFRADLYYRLNVIPIHLPSLREREQDKLEIALSFLQKFSREEGKDFKDFSPVVEEVILNHPWPGNIRQLQNVIRNVVVMHEGQVVEKDMLPKDFLNKLADDLDLKDSAVQTGYVRSIARRRKMTIMMIRPLWETEKKVIEEAIEICDGNIARAAGYLDINPSTIYRKKKFWQQQDAATWKPFLLEKDTGTN